MRKYCLAFRRKETRLPPIAAMMIEFFKNLLDRGSGVYGDNGRRLPPI
jgi:hypothetical protein